MPTVLIENGYRVMIYTRDHEPMHVHIEYQGRKAIIEFESSVTIRSNIGMNRRELRRAFQIVADNQELLAKKWREIYE